MQGVFRNVKAPNVYIREIDRSAYDNDQERSEVDTNVVVCGFAQKGPNLEPRRFIRINDFITTYGYPTNEAERYFYNAADEVLSKGATLIACRLPYDNNSYEHVTFSEYEVAESLDNVRAEFPELQAAYPEIKKCLSINPKASKTGAMSFSNWDSLVTGATKPNKNKFIIVDTTGNKYVRDDYYKDNSVKPKLTITVNGNSSRRVYNSSEQRFEGQFTATCNDSGFDPSKFSYVGNTTASGTAANDYIVEAYTWMCKYNDNRYDINWIIGDPIKLTITPATYNIRIIGNKGEFTYDGLEHEVNGYVVESDDVGFDINKLVFTGTSSIRETNARAEAYLMNLRSSDFRYNDRSVTTINLNIEDGELRINPARITISIVGNNGSFIFDNDSHSVSGYRMLCDNPAYDETKVIFNGSDEISETNAGTYPMNLDASQFDYDDNQNIESATFVVVDGELTILKARIDITITGHTSVVAYDREEHSVSGYEVDCENSLFEDYKISFSGSDTVRGTLINTYPMELDSSDFSYLDENIDAVFNVTDGYLTIENVQLVINVVGHSAQYDYDEESHTVSGYDLSSEQTALFDESKVNFNGTAEITATAGGVYWMGLDESMFSYDDEQITDVRFVVADGCLKIVKEGMYTTVALNDGTIQTIEKSGILNKQDMIDAGLYDNDLGWLKTIIGVQIGTEIEIISDETFYECYELASLTIPDSVTTIRNTAFASCNLQEIIVLADSLESWMSKSFNRNLQGPRQLFIGDQEVTELVISAEITTINDNAFQGFTNIRSLVIPDNVEEIGVQAFSECSGIETVTIGTGLTLVKNGAFYQCTGLNGVYISDMDKWLEITFQNQYANPFYYAHRLFLNGEEVVDLIIPNSITEITDGMFAGFSNLRSVVIPDSVIVIGRNAFEDCTGLTTIEIPDSVEIIRMSAFKGCTGLTTVSIGDGVTKIESDAFSDCNALESITLGFNVAIIDSNAFKNCYNLESIEISNSVRTIGSNAFENCRTLTTVVIPDSVTTIGSTAFYNCSNLESVQIPSTINIGSDAFEGCNNLNDTRIHMLDLANWTSGMFNCNSELLGTRHLFDDTGSITELIIPDEVTDICDNAFKGCSDLTKLVIPDSVTIIGNNAFEGCNSFTEVIVGDGVTNLNWIDFQSCSDLEYVTIGNGVTQIEDDQFNSCANLRSISLGSGITTIGERAFNECTGLTEVRITDLTAWCRISFDESNNPCIYAHHLYLNDEEIIDLVIPDDVDAIEIGAFMGCSDIASVTIPNSVTTICAYAFAECSSLEEITIPDSVTSIEQHAFENCSSLAVVYVSADSRDRIRQLFENAGIDTSHIEFRDLEPQGIGIKFNRRSIRNESNERVGWTNQYLGIVPIIVSPLNALVYQTMLSVGDDDFHRYNLIKELSTIADYKNTPSCILPYEVNVLSATNFETVLSSTTVTTESVGRTVVETVFPQVTYDRTYLKTISQESYDESQIEYGNSLNRTYLNQIGIVVCRMYANPNNDNRIAFDVLESYVGSLNPNAVDDVTGASIYIGNKINTASKYINFFSNIDFTEHSSASEADIITIANQTAYSMGFFDIDTQDDISYQKSIVESLTKVFGKLDDTRSVKIDLVLDAGGSNIAQFLKQIYVANKDDEENDITPGKGKYDPLKDEFIEKFTLSPLTNMGPYTAICKLFENFCRFTRSGDCMFIQDSPRPLSLTGNAKIVRPSQPTNSVSKNILPKLKYIPPMNSCFAAGYAVWFMILDRVNKVYVWIPPSIKAVGRYIYTDRVARPWYAPAGLNRGVIDNVFDISFNPKNSEAGVLYSNSWNYAVNTTFNGVIQEGQRTFQLKPTALDRVNVRRLMSEIEKRVIAIGRHYLYEPLSTANLTFYENDVSKYLSKVQTGEGIEEYIVIADETNNNANTIDNNELHCVVGVRPIKSIEYIFLTFVTTNQSANVKETTIAASR